MQENEIAKSYNTVFKINNKYYPGWVLVEATMDFVNFYADILSYVDNFRSSSNRFEVTKENKELFLTYVATLMNVAEIHEELAEGLLKVYFTRCIQDAYLAATQFEKLVDNLIEWELKELERVLDLEAYRRAYGYECFETIGTCHQFIENCADVEVMVKA